MKKRAIITAILLAILLIGTTLADDQVIIGAIIDKTGDSASYAPGIEAAIDLAVADLTDSYSAAGLNTSFVMKKAMSDGTKEGAVKAAEELINQGVRIIVGPFSSDEVSGILPILTREGIISVNHASSMALSKAGDPLVRLCPDDLKLLQAVKNSNFLFEDKIPMKAVILARDDIYGNLLSDALSLDDHIIDAVTYPPDTKDFTSILNELDSIVTPLFNEVGEKNVVVFAISFDEIADLMAQASAFPNLEKARWEGMDGVALNPSVLANKTAAKFAETSDLTALSFNIAQPIDSDYWRVYDAVKNTTNRHQPSIYEILPYDETLMAAWIIQNNPSNLEEMLYIADNYGKYSYAATGWLKLDQNSDRKYGDYYFYQVKKGDDGNYTWEPVYVYMYESNTTIPLSGVNNAYMQHFQG